MLMRTSVHAFQKKESSRAALRAIEKAALAAQNSLWCNKPNTYAKNQTRGAISRRQQLVAEAPGELKEAMRQVEMEEQAVEAFILQQMSEAQRQLTRMVKVSKFLQSVCLVRKSGSDEEAEASQAKISDLTHMNMQLQQHLSASQAEVADAACQIDTLRAQVQALTQEKRQLKKEALLLQEAHHDDLIAAARTEKSQAACLKEKQERIEDLLLERLELRQSLARRGDANAVIRVLGTIQREVDALKEENAKLQRGVQQAEHRAAEELRYVEVRSAGISASAVSAFPLVSGIEVEEDDEARGHVTGAYASALADFGAREAFRVGRVRVPFGTCSVPVCARVLVENNGTRAWPRTSAAVIVSGDSCALPLATMEPAEPGQSSELAMDLLVPAAACPGVATSVWSLVDAATGLPLGPLLIFEAVWTSP